MKQFKNDLLGLVYSSHLRSFLLEVHLLSILKEIDSGSNPRQKKVIQAAYALFIFSILAKLIFYISSNKIQLSCYHLYLLVPFNFFFQPFISFFFLILKKIKLCNFKKFPFGPSNNEVGLNHSSPPQAKCDQKNQIHFNLTCSTPH